MMLIALSKNWMAVTFAANPFVWPLPKMYVHLWSVSLPYAHEPFYRKGLTTTLGATTVTSAVTGTRDLPTGMTGRPTAEGVGPLPLAGTTTTVVPPVLHRPVGTTTIGRLVTKTVATIATVTTIGGGTTGAKNAAVTAAGAKRCVARRRRIRVADRDVVSTLRCEQSFWLPTYRSPSSSRCGPRSIIEIFIFQHHVSTMFCAVVFILLSLPCSSIQLLR